MQVVHPFKRLSFLDSFQPLAWGLLLTVGFLGLTEGAATGVKPDKV